MNWITLPALVLVLASQSTAVLAAFPCGDLDENGAVETADAAILRTSLAGITSLTAEQQARCDVDASSDCTIVDAALTLRESASLPPGLLCASVCGDGVLDQGETCDDGNIASGDGCDAS